MAAFVTTPQPRKMNGNHLDCPICFRHLKKPKVLDCLHSFCLQCLQDLTLGQVSQTPKITCHICGRETTIKEAADLPDSFTLSALVEEAEMHEQLQGGQGSQVKCQACDAKHRAISRCMDCDHFLCQECHTAHECLTGTSHTIYTLAQLRSGEIAYKSRLRERVPICRKHSDQNLEVYCDTCEQLLCPLCSVLNHSNQNHTLKGLPTAIDRCKQDIAELAAQVEKSRAEFATAANESRKSFVKLDVTCANIKKRITQKADKEVARIRLEEEKMKEQVKKIVLDRFEIFKAAKISNNNEVIQVERKLNEVNQIMAQASCYEILDLKKKLLDNLREMTGKQPEKVPENLSFLDFEEGDEMSLGRLVLEEPELETRDLAEEPQGEITHKWELKAELKTFEPDQTEFTLAWYLSAFSNNEILVTDIDHKQLITCTPSPDSNLDFHVDSQRLEVEGISDPRHIAVSTDDHIIVLDSLTVKIFDSKYQFLHQFIPGTDADSQPTCLAVDDINQIAVGFAEKEVIHLYNPNGSLLKTLPASKINSYLTISEQKLIYTNWEKKKLLSVDYNGDTVFSVDINSDMSNWGPTGVCCDSEGSIYVAVCGDWPSFGEIHHFTPDGEYIGRVIKGHGNLRDITVMPDGDLVVAAVESVKIYHRV